MGWDGIDEMKASARGWHTHALTDLPFKHHRVEGQRDGSRRRARIAQGRAAHYIGYRPSYLVLRSLHHARREPAALAMMWGYADAARPAHAAAPRPGGARRVAPPPEPPPHPHPGARGLRPPLTFRPGANPAGGSLPAAAERP